MGCIHFKANTAHFFYNRSKTFPVSLVRIAACCWFGKKAAKDCKYSIVLHKASFWIGKVSTSPEILESLDFSSTDFSKPVLPESFSIR